MRVWVMNSTSIIKIKCAYWNKLIDGRSLWLGLLWNIIAKQKLAYDREFSIRRKNKFYYFFLYINQLVYISSYTHTFKLFDIYVVDYLPNYFPFMIDHKLCAVFNFVGFSHQSNEFRERWHFSLPKLVS